jgi:tRNA(fMet)-specific endonuclease VapC
MRQPSLPGRPANLAHRFIQYTGQVAISAVTLAELYARAYKHSQVARLVVLINDLLQEVHIIDFDSLYAQKFGQVRGSLLQQGISVPTTDLMIASAAVVHNLTLVTRNTADFQNVPGLRLDDWLTP